MNQPHHNVAANMHNNGSSHGRTAKQSPVYHWRCTDTDCQQINQTRNVENSVWYDKACSACGNVPGKDVCLLQIIVSTEQETMKGVVRSSFKLDGASCGGP